MTSRFGPGWFYDVFRISVEFKNVMEVQDTGEIFAVPWSSYNGRCPLIVGRESSIDGSVVLSTWSGREVWHGGINVCVHISHFIYIFIRNRFIFWSISIFLIHMSLPTSRTIKYKYHPKKQFGKS
jgi:hypothetical protein